MEPFIESLVESMFCHIGQTVTIFTTSGGISGAGFTGVLISADCNVIRLLCDIGEAPACPVGSPCTSIGTPYGYPENSNGFYGNPLGAIAVIPTCAIACFTHHAI